MLGKILFFDRFKGYGFIVPDGPDTTVDIFFHYSAIVGAKRCFKGQHVQFELGPSPKQPTRIIAVRVEPLESPLSAGLGVGASPNAEARQ